MNDQTNQRKIRNRNEEFRAGFLAGLTVVGGLALILFAWFFF